MLILNQILSDHRLQIGKILHKKKTLEPCIANGIYMQALYHEYYGDRQGALENYIQCGNWKKAHTIFMTSVAHSLFLSCKFSMQCTNQIVLNT
jgi:hypothetical protein